jgi:hypothetical protein
MNPNSNVASLEDYSSVRRRRARVDILYRHHALVLIGE